MSLPVVLVDEGTGNALHSEPYYLEGEEGRVLLTETISGHYGTFKTAAFTVQGTTELISVKGSESIKLTDLIVSFEKKNLASVTINFHDGTNTAPLLKATINDAPVNMSCNMAGNWHGWQGAHIDVIIAGANAIGTVAIGYVKYPTDGGLPYAEWNARR